MSEAAPHRWAALYPELGTGPVSTEPCVSPEFYARERDAVFKKAWLMVARDEELPKPGDYKVKRLDVANCSVIIMRGKDGVVRGYYNVCSHRGNTVVTEAGDETFGSSKAAVLSCRFHGWVYDAEGGLIQVPKEERFYACFDKAENGLTTVRTEVWEGFIFVNLDSEGSQSLIDYLGDYAGHMGGFPYSELSECYSYWTNLQCNWKVSHDAFAEAYHVHTIHAGSFPNTFSSGLANVRMFGPHRTAAVCLSPSAELRPVQTVADKIAGGYAGAHHGGLDPAAVGQSRRHGGFFLRAQRHLPPICCCISRKGCGSPTSSGRSHTTARAGKARCITARRAATARAGHCNARN